MSNKTNPKIEGIKKQRTFCILKPDAVSRGLIGEILHRVEKSGLKVVAMKMTKATKEQIIKHYPMSDQAWIDRLGEKGLGTFDELKLDAKEFLGTDNKSEIGKKVSESLIEYMTSGPVVCVIFEGVQAIDMLRKLCGHTLPFKADAGTIRGDFSVDSPASANIEGRAIHNLIHASETPEEAENEVKLWFTETEMSVYERSDYLVSYSKYY